MKYYEFVKEWNLLKKIYLRRDVNWIGADFFYYDAFSASYYKDKRKEAV